MNATFNAIRYSIGALLLALATATYATSAGEAILYFAGADMPGGPSPRGFSIQPGKTEVLQNIDLGESIEGGRLLVMPSPTTGTQYKVEVQFETSVTIMDEGPHLDLLDWHHHTSPWRTLLSETPGSFVVPVFTDAERKLFPDVRESALKSAVHAAGGARWSSILRGGVTEYPAGVDISAIRIKVTRIVHGDADAPFILVIPVAMGC